MAEVADEDMIFKILASIDSGERMQIEQIPDYDFKDGFEIIVEYEIHRDLMMHPDMAHHMVIMIDGTCWLYDGRVTNPVHGSPFQMMDKDFYGLPENLFQ